MADVTKNININLNDDGANKSIEDLKKKLTDIVNTAKVELILDAKEAESKLSNFKSQLESVVSPKLDLELNINDQSIPDLQNSINSIETPPINLDVLVNDESIPELKSELESIQPEPIKLDVEVTGDSIPELKSEIDSIESQPVNIDVTVNDESIPDLKSNIDSIQTEPVNIDVTVNDESIPELKTQLDSIQPDPISLDVEVDNKEIDTLQTQIRSIEPEPIKLDVKTDKSKIQDLINNIGNVGKQIDIISKKNVDVDIKDNTKDIIDNISDIDTSILKLTSVENKIDVIIDDAKSISSVTELKKQIKELEGLALQAGDSNSKAYLKATQAAGQLQDRLGDIKDATKTFSAGDPVEGLSKGFGNLKNKLTDLDFQGFIEETQRLNVFSQQLTFDKFGKSIGDVSKGFVNLGKVLLTNPLFLLAAAIGLIIANFDKLLGLIDGVSDAQEDNLEIAKEQLTAEQEKLDSMGLQENSLRLQGKTEKEILQLKLAQTEETIAAAEIALQQQEALAASQLEASKRNQEILKGVLDFVSAPLLLLLGAIDEIGLAFGKSFDLKEGFKESVSSLIFDPEEVKKEGDEATKVQRDALETLVSQRDGIKLQLRDIDKKAGEERIEQTKQETEAIEEIEKLLADKRLSAQEKELNDLDAFYADRRETLNKAFEGDIANESERQKQQTKLDEQYYQDRLDIIDSFILNAEQKQQELNDFLENNGPQTQEQERAAEIASIEKKYNDELVLAQENAKNQIEVERILREELENLKSSGGKEEDISKLENKLDSQIEATRQASVIEQQINSEKVEAITDKNNEFYSADEQLRLENNLLDIQNQTQSIQNAKGTSELRIKLLNDEFEANKLLREKRLSDELSDVNLSELEKENIRAKFRAEELNAESKLYEDKNKLIQENIDKLKNASDQIAASLNLIGDAAGGVYGEVNNLVGSLVQSGVGLKQTFTDLSSNIKKIDEDLAAGAITAEEASKDKFDSYSAGISSGLGAISSAVSQVGAILAAQSQQQIQEINEVTNAQLLANQTESDSKLAELEKQKNAGIISEKQFADGVDKIKKSAASKEQAIKAEGEKKELAAKRKAFNQNKNIQVINAVIATAQGVVAAFQLGPIAGAIMAAVIGALGVAQIATISSQKFPEGGGAPSGGGGAPSISTPDIGGGGDGGSPFAAPQFFDIGQQTTQTTPPQPIIIENNISATEVSRVQNDIASTETSARIT